MTTRARRIGAFSLGAAALITWAIADLALPAVGAGMLLHPLRRADTGAQPAGCESAQFAGAGVNLPGWRCSTDRPRRGSVVYLHGVADNRRSARRVVERFLPRGFDVVA